MSYILDALRRAEAERERGGVPGLHAQATGAVSPSSDGRSPVAARWTLPVIGALGVAVVLLGWRPWAADPAVPAASVPGVTPVVPPAGAPVDVPPPVQPVRRAATPVPAVKKRPPVAASAPTAAAEAASAAPANQARVYSVGELPADVRQQLPSIAIGGSIYSANPASRFVIVNGQLFHEGDTLAPGLVLDQIRLKSAVLSFRGYRYGITF